MVARTVLHGVDESVPTSKLAALLGRANHASKIYDETTGKLFIFDGIANQPFVIGGGGYFYSASSPRLLTDNFDSTTLNSGWTVNKGSDPQCVNFATVAADPGYAKGTTGDAGSSAAVDCVSITGPLVFEAEEGEILFSARVKVDAVTNLGIFIGLSDALASTLEMPATLSVVTYTTNASDAVGFLLDTAATTDTIRCVGVDTDVDVTHVDTADAWAADTWKIFQLRVATNGTTKFYIDGTLVATIAACVTPGVDLCPIVAAVSRTTASRIVSIDYIACR